MTIRIVFVSPDGSARQIEAHPGETVMASARDNDVRGILADCGGARACATCHVHVDPQWFARVGPPDAEEADLLQMAIDPSETSRLSCQILVTEALDGLVLRLPESQI